MDDIRKYAYLCGVIFIEELSEAIFTRTKLKTLGCGFHRHGNNHDIWNYENGRKFPFARHSDIDERLAKSMIDKSKKKQEKLINLLNNILLLISNTNQV